MVLNVTATEMQRLIDDKVIRPLSEDESEIIVVSPKTGSVLSLKINVTLTEEEKKQILEKKKPGPKKIKESFEEFKNLFPRSDKHSHFYKTRNLMSGTTTNSYLRYSKLVTEEGFSPDDILRAMEHEVTWRVRASLQTGRNKLTYMRAFEAWLNNTENIKTQLEEIKQSGKNQDIIDQISHEDESGRATRTL